MPVIPATLEANAGVSRVQGQPGYVVNLNPVSYIVSKKKKIQYLLNKYYLL
jgi:hypothetical protein